MTIAINMPKGDIKTFDGKGNAEEKLGKAKRQGKQNLGSPAPTTSVCLPPFTYGGTVFAFQAVIESMGIQTRIKEHELHEEAHAQKINGGSGQNGQKLGLIMADADATQAVQDIQAKKDKTMCIQYGVQAGISILNGAADAGCAYSASKETKAVESQIKDADEVNEKFENVKAPQAAATNTATHTQLDDDATNLAHQQGAIDPNEATPERLAQIKGNKELSAKFRENRADHRRDLNAKLNAIQMKLQQRTQYTGVVANIGNQATSAVASGYQAEYDREMGVVESEKAMAEKGQSLQEKTVEGIDRMASADDQAIETYSRIMSTLNQA